MSLVIGQYDKKLEGLRGLCALTVAIGHLLEFNFFGSFKIPHYSYFQQLQFGHVAVVIFFIISGYVIGISHLHTDFTKKNILKYFKKRAVRLYPIYIIALFISIAVNVNVLPISIGHFFFLQEIFTKTILTNVVLWSLSYEVVYYIIFIFLWAIKRNQAQWYLFTIIVVLTYVIISPHFTILKSLLVGWVFWISGLILSDLGPLKADLKANSKPLLSYFFILLATYHLDSGGIIMHILHINFDSKKMIFFSDLFLLPVCALIIATLTKKNSILLNWLAILVYTIPTINIALLIYFKHPISTFPERFFGVIFYGIALFLIWLKVNIYAFEKLNYIGQISYAIYVFHFPVGWFLNLYLPHYFSGKLLFIVGTLVWIIITLSISIICELKLQPIVKNFFFKRPG